MLRSTGAAVCGASRVLMYRPVTAEAWRYRPSGEEGQWLSGAPCCMPAGCGPSGGSRRSTTARMSRSCTSFHTMSLHPRPALLRRASARAQHIDSGCIQPAVHASTAQRSDGASQTTETSTFSFGMVCIPFSVSRPSAPSESVSVVASFDVTTATALSGSTWSWAWRGRGSVRPGPAEYHNDPADRRISTDFRQIETRIRTRR